MPFVIFFINNKEILVNYYVKFVIETIWFDRFWDY